METNQKLFTIKDVYKHNDTNEPMDITKEYDPLHFWEDFGEDYLKSFKNQKDITRHVVYITSRLKSLDINTLYDAGCGFARLAPFIIKSDAATEITSIDISQKQLDSANKYLEGFEKRDKIKLMKQSIKWSNTPANSYDCTMSVECLQHMKLSSARYAIRELVKLSKKYIIIVERFVCDGEHPLPNVWSHNYYKLIDELGVKILEYKLIDNGVVGIVLKK